MNRRDFLRGGVAATTLPLLTTRLSEGQVRDEESVDLAERLKPSLVGTVHLPASIVEPTADSAAFLRWRLARSAAADAIGSRLFKPGDAIVLDFGTHLTGYFTLSLRGEGRGIDAPARLKFTFGEVPGEIAEPFDPYKGWLSRAWLQDEIINVDVLPATIQLPRRYAFRYVKIEIVATSANYVLRIDDVKATAVTSGSGRIATPDIHAGASETDRRDQHSHAARVHADRLRGWTETRSPSLDRRSPLAGAH
jgi:hypothetical protein